MFSIPPLLTTTCRDPFIRLFHCIYRKAQGNYTDVLKSAVLMVQRIMLLIDIANVKENQGVLNEVL